MERIISDQLFPLLQNDIRRLSRFEIGIVCAEAQFSQHIRKIDDIDYSACTECIHALGLEASQTVESDCVV